MKGILLLLCAVIVSGCSTTPTGVTGGAGPKVEELAVAGRQVTIPQWKFSFEIASEKWDLKPASHQKKFSRDMYIFTREAIADSQGRPIVPAFSLVKEKVIGNLDAVRYSIACRSTADFKVEEVFIHSSGRINLKNAIAYKGKYSDSLGEHTMYVVHAVEKGVGLQIILDATSEVFSSVEPEFNQILKSYRFVD
jgi:hypothetical protein